MINKEGIFGEKQISDTKLILKYVGSSRKPLDFSTPPCSDPKIIAGVKDSPLILVDKIHHFPSPPSRRDFESLENSQSHLPPLLGSDRSRPQLSRNTWDNPPYTDSPQKEPIRIGGAVKVTNGCTPGYKPL